MDGRNLERVREAIESVDAFWALLDDYVVWDLRRAASIPDLDDVYVGRDAVVNGSRRYWGTWADYSVEPEELIEAGSSVVVILRERGRGKSSGAPFDRQHPQLWTFRGDRLIRWDSFQTKAEALDAAGISE